VRYALPAALIIADFMILLLAPGSTRWRSGERLGRAMRSR